MEPTIICPSCHTEIKLTESLAAPLIEATRQQYEKKLQQQNADVTKREQLIKDKEVQLTKDKESLDAAVAEKVKLEREKLAAEASRKEQAFKQREEALLKEKEAIDSSVAERVKLEREKINADVLKKEKAFKDREEALLKEKDAIDSSIAEKLKVGRAQIAVEEAKKAKLALGDDLETKSREIAELSEVLKKRDEKLAEAQKAQAQLVVKERELADAKREMELTIETRITESLAKVRELAKKDAEQELSLKVIEKDLAIKSMMEEIESLKRKAEQGSQERQGEALEWQLETLLSGKFLHDTIEPVPKGEYGGDIVQRVNTSVGTTCGTILWEAKRTKTWQDSWLPKLRNDQRLAKAEVAIIVSAVLPKDVETFDQIDGVWVVHPRSVLPVAMSLRNMLIEVSTARKSSEGQQTKMEMIYQYLTGPKFRLRVEALAEVFSSMSEDLFKEKKAVQRHWAKREEQISRMMETTVGMYGELQGIAGKSLGEIEGLQLEPPPSSIGELESK